MSALTVGATAPNIDLKTSQGESFLLNELRQKHPVVAAFFKVGCPTCQYAFPFLERLYKAYPPDKISLVGISQDSKQDTDAFTSKYGITFPILLDDLKKYSASNAYGLTNVPSTFVVSQAGEIAFSSVGWLKHEMEQLNQMMAQSAGVKPAEIFHPGEDIAEFKAG